MIARMLKEQWDQMLFDHHRLMDWTNLVQFEQNRPNFLWITMHKAPKRESGGLTSFYFVRQPVLHGKYSVS